ncbi:MAG: cytochrome c [Saccharospirillaceae bacterium]|nr:cytochrome c [Pseudomonadales bacterium]NRB80717.1 cytochrome c [Saccharospirillaceae bacterium]
MNLKSIVTLSLLLSSSLFLSCVDSTTEIKEKIQEERNTQIVEVNAEANIQETEPKTEFKQYNSTIAAQEEAEIFIVPQHNLKTQSTNRWYELDQIEKGKKLYDQTCIACHLQNAEGTENWQDSLDEGGYPPPPLNGSAHTWHHPLAQLHEVIKYGLIEYGTTMPAWGSVYTDKQILDLIASFQSYWDDETYNDWIKRH